VLETLDAALADPRAARALQTRLSHISRIVEGNGIPAVKAASSAAGLRSGFPRLPLTPADDELSQTLQDAVQAI
jgi:dihydrodipicolinate synthase/N-acetylneuraminate lyase